jgi:DNA-binding response OmpR family regulator
MEMVEKILVVAIDDEPDVLMTLQMLLELFNYEVITGRSGEKVVVELERFSRPPDIIIADYRLGTGKLGTHAIRMLRDVTGVEMPGLIITGDTSPERIKEVEASGFHILHKPVRAERMKSMIEDLLRR